MDFAINSKAEGRILIPWEDRHNTKHDSNHTLEDLYGSKFQEDWKDDGTIWESFRKTCPPDSLARTDPNRRPPPPEGDFNFAEDVDNHYDFCNKPWDKSKNGHFFSDWRTIPALYPVFSPGKAPGFSDIRIPSHYYYYSSTRYTYGWVCVLTWLSAYN